jgi:spore coat protein CotH
MIKQIFIFIVMMMFVLLLQSCQIVLIPELEQAPETELVPIEEDALLLDENYDRFFDEINHKKLIIQLSTNNARLLNSVMQDYFDNFGNYRSDTYVSSNILYEDAYGAIEMKDVPFRTRGNLSRTRFLNDEGDLNFNHFKLKFNQQFLNTSRDGFLFGLEELDLKFNRNQDETYMNEFGALKLYESLGVFSQRSTLIFVEVHIDDNIYQVGVMTAFEPIDEWFIKRRFETSENQIGDLYKSLWQQFGPANLTNFNEGTIGIKDVENNYRPAYDLKTNKLDSMHEHLLLLIDVLSSEDINYKKAFVETYFDIDQLARYFAVSLLLGNPDDFRAMANNYYLYFDIVGEKYHIIPYDLDHSLGQGWQGAPVFQDQLANTNLYHFGEIFSYLVGQAIHHPLIEVVFELKNFRTLYELYLNTLLETTFQFQFFKDYIDLFQPIFEKDISDSMLNLPFGYRNLESFIELKRQSVLSQLNETT